MIQLKKIKNKHLNMLDQQNNFLELPINNHKEMSMVKKSTKTIKAQFHLVTNSKTKSRTIYTKIPPPHQ